MEELGPVSDEVREKIMTEKNLETLQKWLKLAANAESMEEFLKAMQNTESILYCAIFMLIGCFVDYLLHEIFGRYILGYVCRQM